MLKIKNMGGGTLVKLDADSLVKAELQGLQLNNANLTRQNLSRSNLAGASLKTSYLVAAKLQLANLEDADLSKSFAVGANFCGAHLARANLSSSMLENVNFQTADLTGADFHNAKLFGARFQGARIEGADFTGATLNHPLSEELQSAFQIFAAIGSLLGCIAGAIYTGPLGFLLGGVGAALLLDGAKSKIFEMVGAVKGASGKYAGPQDVEQYVRELSAREPERPSRTTCDGCARSMPPNLHQEQSGDRFPFQQCRNRAVT